MPEYIVVEIKASEYKGREQWVARYRLYHNGNDSDYIDVVVNLPRHFRPWPEAGERLWVKPSGMAPQKRLVFSEAYGRVRDHDSSLTVRMGEDLMLKTFRWSKNDGDYRTFYDDWKVILRDASGICEGEPWRVRVTWIDPSSGLIEVHSVGPHPKAHYEPPEKVGLMGVIPIYAKRDVLEGDLLAYRSGWRDRDLGGKFDAEIEHNGRIVPIRCSQLRRVSARDKDGKEIEKIVGLVIPSGSRGYLAEIVLVEGEMVLKPPSIVTPARHPLPLPVEDDPDDGYEGSQQQYEDEVRANSDSPPYD